MKKRTASLFCALGLLLGLAVASGCYDIEQSITLDRNLAGKASFRMAVDLLPAARAMLRLRRAGEGEMGEPGAAEIEAAEASFRTEVRSPGDAPTAESVRAELEGKLPLGVELAGLDVRDRGERIEADLDLRFQDVKALREVRIPGTPPDAEHEGGPIYPGVRGPAEAPFSDLQVVDEGGTILLTSVPMNPFADQQDALQEMDLTPELQKKVAGDLRALRFVFRLEAPFEVVESNATRRQGKTLIWELDDRMLEKMKPGERDQAIRVRYRK